MRILVGVLRFPVLSETFVLRQITGMLRAGHDVEVAALQRGAVAELHADARDLDVLARVRWLDVPETPAGRLARTPGVLLRTLAARPAAASAALSPLRHGIDALSLRPLFEAAPLAHGAPYDVAHCHFGTAGRHGVRWKRSGIARALVVTFHANDLVIPVRQHGADYYAALFAAADALIAVSQHGRRRLCDLGAPPGKILIHPYGIEWTGEAPAAQERIPGRFRLLSVGRLVEKKGLDDTIDAVGRLAAAFPDLQLEHRIVGEGPLRAGLEALAARLPERVKVRFLGAVDVVSVRDEMRRCDVFVLPSKTAADGDEEGQPNVLLEAMCLGVPVVATFHAGTPELIEHERTGLLAPESDPARLAELIATLYRDAERARRLGEAGREFVRTERDMERLNERLIGLYREILAAAP